MVQVIDTGGSVAGRIGKGFGQGLAEQLPKEIERYRLSSGLNKLGKQDLSGKNQLQLLSQIYSIPGMTPEIANLAQQQIAKQNFLNRKPGEPAPTTGTPATSTNQKPSPQGAAVTKQPISEAGFATPEQIKEMKSQYFQEPTYADTKSLADDYLNQGITQNPDQALVLAKQELAQNRAAQQQKNQGLKTFFNERMAKSLQGGGLGDYKDVVGDIQTRLLDQGEYMVNQLGYTPEQAAEKLNDIALELGKSANNLKETGGFWNMFRSSSKKSQELREQREIFSKYGFGEEFDDMAAAKMGITPLQAANVLDPLNNKAIQARLDKYTGIRKHFKNGSSNFKMKEDDLDQIIKNITPKDNLYSIEYLLREKGFDVNQFKQRVAKLKDEKEISLTPQQIHQQRRAVSNSYLGDILYQAF